MLSVPVAQTKAREHVLVVHPVQQDGQIFVAVDFVSGEQL